MSNDIDNDIEVKRSKCGFDKKLDECIEILSASVMLVRLAGVKSFCSVIAGQLRLLLCDIFRDRVTRKFIDNSLIYKVKNNPTFPQVTQDFIVSDPGTKFINPANLFDKSKPYIPLQKWLKQGLIYTTYLGSEEVISILDVIKHTANKQGGAHVDAKLKGRELFATALAEAYLPNISICVMDVLGFNWQIKACEVLARLKKGIIEKRNS